VGADPRPREGALGVPRGYSSGSPQRCGGGVFLVEPNSPFFAPFSPAGRVSRCAGPPFWGVSLCGPPLGRCFSAPGFRFSRPLCFPFLGVFFRGPFGQGQTPNFPPSFSGADLGLNRWFRFSWDFRPQP